MPIKVIMKSIYGSHLFGTSTPNSDKDFKQIHMSPTDLILMDKATYCINEKTREKGSNTKDDVDCESKELKTFIYDCISGQTYAIDLLFAPDVFILKTSDLWEEIRSKRHLLVNNLIRPFVKYAKNQASKYSEKGLKYNELNEFISIAKGFEIGETIKNTIASFGDLSRFSHFKYELKMLDELTGEDYLYAPDCSFPSTRKWKEVIPVLEAKIKSFGKRVEEAAANNGKDLKAFYHALRVVWQLEEYITTQSIKFPSDRVHHLIDVRAGKYSREYIEQWISSEIERILLIPNNLPEADYTHWDNWLLDKYMLQAHEQSSEYLKLRGLTP